MSSNSEGSGNSVGGEVIRGEVTRREETRRTMVGAIFSRLSRLPFVNVWLEKKIDTARGVVKGEKDLFKDLAEHEQSFNRLLKIDLILRDDDATMEANAVEAENRLAAAKREEAARKQEDAIFRLKKDYEESQGRMRNEYELKRLEMEHKKRLHALEREMEELRNPPPPPPPEDKIKLLERAYAKRDSAIKRIDKLRNATPQTKRDLKKAAENALEKEIQRIEAIP